MFVFLWLASGKWLAISPLFFLFNTSFWSRQALCCSLSYDAQLRDRCIGATGEGDAAFSAAPDAHALSSNRLAPALGTPVDFLHLRERLDVSLSDS